jgi:hypothetical protein
MASTDCHRSCSNGRKTSKSANIIQSIEEVWHSSGAEGHNKIPPQIPEKECFSLSVFCASHHPDALLVSHLETRT